MQEKNLSSALQRPQEITRLLLKLKKDEYLPRELFYLKNLIKLEINAPFLKELPTQLSSLIHLRYLSIINHRLTSFDGPHLPHLKTLKIKNGDLKDFTHHGLPQLSLLDLSHNKLQVMAPSICNLSGLNELYLSYNNISKLENIGVLKNLRRLSLDQNKLTTLPEQLKELVYLTHLGVANNSFDLIEKERIQKEFNIWF